MGAMAFMDAHCHLQDPRLTADLAGVLSRAKAAGVSAWVVCGTSESDWEAVLALNQAHRGVIPMLGLHPWHVRQALPGWEQRLEQRLRESGAGSGECGLDFALEGSDLALQERCFRTQIRLARALDRPLSIHCRNAWAKLRAIAVEEGLPAAGALIHSFSGSAETARELQDLGFHLSFSCAIAQPSNHKAAKVLPEVWPDRLLLESDAPDLPPRHLEGWQPDRPNEPANVPLVAQAAARLRNETSAAIEQRALSNSRGLFGRWLP